MIPPRDHIFPLATQRGRIADMDAWRFILASLRHYRRIHIAVALGVAVATAVLTGALVVGDSMRGSLRDLTLQRLGYIDSAIVAGHPFREELADELAADPEFKKHFVRAMPALLSNGTLQAGSGGDARRASGISVIGTGPGFWVLGQGKVGRPLGNDEVAITEPIARELGVLVGSDVLLRIPVVSSIPADSTLGEKSESSRSRTLKVGAIHPAEGLARFGIVPSQNLPRNVFVDLSVLQSLLKQPGKANAILVATEDLRQAAGTDAERSLANALRPTLADYGLKLDPIGPPANGLQLSADQLVLPDEAVRAVEKAMSADGVQPVVTYLANTISVGEGESLRKIPYSTVAGVDSTKELGPLLDERGEPIKLADGEIVLSRWAADDLGAKVGNEIAITYYEPESTHGQLHEHQPPPKFKLKAIVELETQDGQPTLAADPKLTPELPGVTDQKSISDWDLPFDLVEKIRPQDEEYWDIYRTTPKAFVSLETAKKLWASRWGTISSVRFHVDGSLRDPNSRLGETRPRAAELIEREISPSALGMTLLPVKAEGLSSSAGTTPFEALFLGFSFFLIAAAVMLVALLFQLGIEQRAGELGTLGAVGMPRRRMTRLLAREGFIVAAAGATAGVLAGVFYAWLMIYGLRTWWLAAISTPFLELHWTWRSLLIGWLTGIAVSWATIHQSIRRLVRQPARRLLAGATETPPISKAASGKRPRLLAWPVLRMVLAALVVLQCVIGFYLRGESQAGIFFGSGAAMLALLLGEVRYRLRHFGREWSFERSFTLPWLSALNTARNPGRSTLTVGLAAAATFLIVAVSAFRLDTGEGGTGGFEFLATSDLPIHYDLNTPDGRLKANVSDEPRKGETTTDEQIMSGYRFFALRVADGEDASCLNLYQPKQPRVLGVPPSFVERGGFAWAAARRTFADRPWNALDAKLGHDDDGREVVPVVLDKSTAVYSLHLGGVGSRLTIRDAANQPVELEIVGLLDNSVLQGNLLVSESNFLKLFPDVAGYRYFLIERLAANAAAGERSLPTVLESTFENDGVDVVFARDELAQFLAVQNTYLSTFQSLGALGLLLGTVGLAVAQLRSVLERRGELALMRAGGFRASRLTGMVTWENAVLLLGGLVIGIAAAAIALVPQWIARAAGVPWGTLGLLVGAIGLVGLMAGWLTTRSTVRAPIVPALRGD
jgi:ABC-type lipoprotein release transport system permease subunit